MLNSYLRGASKRPTATGVRLNLIKQLTQENKKLKKLNKALKKQNQELWDGLLKYKVDKAHPGEFELLSKAPLGQVWQLVER